jgi:hypothetical protein
MLKIIVVVLASFMAVGFIGSFFPSVFTSSINIGNTQISTYFLSMVGTICTFYKVVA